MFSPFKVFDVRWWWDHLLPFGGWQVARWMDLEIKTLDAFIAENEAYIAKIALLVVENHKKFDDRRDCMSTVLAQYNVPGTIVMGLSGLRLESHLDASLQRYVIRAYKAVGHDLYQGESSISCREWRRDIPPPQRVHLIERSALKAIAALSQKMDEDGLAPGRDRGQSVREHQADRGLRHPVARVVATHGCYTTVVTRTLWTDRCVSLPRS